MRFALCLFCALALAACTPRGEFGFAPAGGGGQNQEVWAAAFRSTDPPAPGNQSPPRPAAIQFERYDISIPPGHVAGQIEWPDGAPNPATDFVTTARDQVPNVTAFSREVARAGTGQRTVLFVHGYNYTHAEAVYEAAKIAHDFELEGPLVLFSWPSAGTPVGYLYDRDSVLIARDALRDTILALARDPNRKLEIVAHSMGNLLVMETLRQIEISGRFDIASEIAALIMISPDIDGELFYTQASRLSSLPRETVILAARQDQALRLSARLTGRTNRLGSETDRAAVRDLPITVVDTSDLSSGGGSHSVPFTSPDAIAVLRRLNQQTTGPRTFTEQVVNLADFR